MDESTIAAKYETVTKAAKIKGVTRGAIYQAIEAEQLEAVEVLGRWLVTRASLEQYAPRKYPRQTNPSNAIQEETGTETTEGNREK